MEENKLKNDMMSRIRNKIKERSIRSAEKIAVRSAKKEMKELSKKYDIFIEEILNKCVDLVSFCDKKQSKHIITIILCRILQGFDSREEMEIVIDMVIHTIDEYWKLDDIPQKKQNI